MSAVIGDDGLRLSNAAPQHLAGCSRVIIFDTSNRIFYATFKDASAAELQTLTAAFEDREQAIRRGLHIQGRRFEVFQHHVDGQNPALIYGRSMQGDPEISTGAAVARTTLRGAPVYVAITFELPATAARMVAVLVAFCRAHMS